MTGSAAPRETFDAHGDSVRPEVLAAFERAWDEIAGPGTWWDGPSRVAIAAAARAARGTTSTDHDALPSAALEACRLLATRPAGVTEEWLRSVCDEISEPRYVELVGIVARVMAIDTFHRLAGWPLTPLPAARPGDPSREPPPGNARKNHTWVAMVRPAAPFVLSSVPGAMRATNDLSDVLYMPMDQMRDPDWRRGELDRTQVELVAATTSHANQCFY
jgi:hypothetical protein